MIQGYYHPKFGPQAVLSRSVINQRIKRIRRMFRWAVEQEILPATVLYGLQAVPPLKRGRSVAKESLTVLSVSRAVVDDTLEASHECRGVREVSTAKQASGGVSLEAQEAKIRAYAS